MDLHEHIKVIEHTRLLFETSMELKQHLGRSPKNESHNTVSSSKRSKKLIEKDYLLLKSFVDSMYKDFMKVTCVPRIELDFIIDCYKRASESGNFSTPANTRSGKTRGEERRVFYDGHMSDSKELQKLLFNFMSGKHVDEKYLKALGLTKGDPRTIFDNYLCAIGILLLIGSIPQYNEYSRPGRTKRNLAEDTNKAFWFLKCLRDMSVECVDNFDWQLRKLENLSYDPSWSRLKLIVAVANLMTWLAKRINPVTEESMDNVIETLPCKDGSWRNIDEEDTSIYQLKSRSDAGKVSHILRRLRPGMTKWDKYELTFFYDKKVLVYPFADDFDLICRQTSGDSLGLSFLSDVRITIIGDDVFENISLRPAKDFEIKSERKPADEEDEKIRIAVLKEIMGSAIILEDDRTRYEVTSNKQNGLDSFIGTLRLTDKVVIVESVKSDDRSKKDVRRVLVFDTDLLLRRYDISTEEKMKEYGVSILRDSPPEK